MRLLFTFLFSVLINILLAQNNLFVPSNIAKSYIKGTRQISGKPGEKYWQNSADYNIDVEFNPETQLLQGEEKIKYYNNSTDTLQEIVLKLYPNLYKKGAVRLTKISSEDVHSGMEIEQLIISDKTVTSYIIDGTNLFLKINPLPPLSSVELKLSFNYKLNKGSHNRTGMIDAQSAFVAYFFPRITVYDDIDGWNRNAYIGTQEFYNDFSNFAVNITVPDNYIVWATGNLQNCSDVLNETYCKRLEQSETTDSIIMIVSKEDIAKGNITKNNVKNTWRFTADNVTDFVFALSKHYVWHATSVMVDSTTKRRTRCETAYNPEHKDYTDVLEFNYKTVKAMSFAFPAWPFPYPHITIFDGLDQMEYPMMVNDNPLERFDAITTTDHEVFHSMFPFYMGINETKYGWMDEGWATLGEWIISSIIDSTIQDDYGMYRYNNLAGHEEDLPITTLSTQLNGNALFLNSYVKPGLGYKYIKDYLGDKLFTKCIHTYISNWQGKHPMPYDFFNSINTAAGQNLNWFWKNWFFENGVPDLKIKSVNKVGKNYFINIERVGSKMVPVDVNIMMADKTQTSIHKSIAVWQNGENNLTIKYTSPGEIEKITIGSLYIPDVNKSNNIWYNHK